MPLDCDREPGHTHGTWDRDSSDQGGTVEASGKVQGRAGQVAKRLGLNRRQLGRHRHDDEYAGLGVPAFDVLAGRGEAASIEARGSRG